MADLEAGLADETLADGADDGADGGVDAGDGVDGSGAGDQGDGGGDGAGGDGSGGDGAGAGESGAVVLDDDGKPLKLSAAAKAELDKIKATNAPLAKELRTAVFESAALRKDFPGGVREAVELRQQWDALGGEQGIGEMRENLEYLQGIDAKFTAGDESIVETLYAASPEGFAKLVQPIFSKFAEVNPKGFAGLFGRVFASDMGKQGVPLAMLRLKDQLADKPEALKLWNSIAGYMDRVSDYAELPVFEPGAGGGAGKPGEGDAAAGLAEREKALTTREWSGEREGAKTAIFQREFTRLIGTRKVTAEQKDAILELFDGRLRKALASDPRHAKTIDQFFAAKNKAGYLKHMKTAYGTAIPRALGAAINAVLPAKPGPKGAAAGAGAPGGKGGGAAGLKPGAKPAGESKVERVTARPAMDTVRHDIRTKDMVRQGLFPLKNGTMVKWQQA